MDEEECDEYDEEYEDEVDEDESQECSCGYYCMDCLGMSWRDFM